jgi:D-alanine-D-alanine ligase
VGERTRARRRAHRARARYPVFVKPANLGSSVGISKAHDRKELGPALDLAAKYDRKLVVEQGVGGRRRARASLRSPCSATTPPKASVVGEIVPGKEFYDYEAKYLSEGSVPVIPAKLSRSESKKFARWPSPPSAPATLRAWRAWTS